MNKDVLKDLVAPGVYEVVDKATDHYKRANDALEWKEKFEQISEGFNSNTNWQLQLTRGNQTIHLNNVGTFGALQTEIIKQYLTLMEAVYYSEMRDAINKFNNSLKERNDGKDTSK